MPHRLFSFVLLFTIVSPLARAADVSPAGRQETLLSDTPWQFAAGATAAEPGTDAFEKIAWQPVKLPHVFWSRVGPSEEILVGWYRRDLDVPADRAGKRLYLVFEGVGAVADVYVNGTHLGQHRGAYTRFIFDATDALHAGQKNALAVHVDNSPAAMKDCLPSGSRLYKVYGGIYRKVWLLATDPLHVDPTDFASPGVYITPRNVTEASADLSVKVMLRNGSPAAQAVEVRATLLGPDDQPVFTLSAPANLAADGRDSVTLTGRLERPKLWTPKSPNLYHVRVEVLKSGQVTDTVTQPTGFRTLMFKDGLATLNGRPIVLAGADLHQEIESKAAAMSDDDFRGNYALMQDLGFNWVRLPHYPHARLEYDLCDRLGLFCWAENGHTNGDDSDGETARRIVTEMVKQNCNHPSIAVWSAGNEASAGPAEKFVAIIKSLDDTRPVAVANMKCKAADFHAANTYQGWYGKDDMWKFKAAGYVAETGAGGVVSVHCDYADAAHKVNAYEPEEYQQLFAESHLQLSFRDNDQLGMFTWWCMRDFNDVKYKKSWNTKGLLTYAGDKKDVYYLFRCFLNPTEPTVRLASKRYFLRAGSAANGIKAYSNAPRLTLTLNGENAGMLKNGQYKQVEGHEVDNVFYWPAKLHTGKNVMTVADDAGHSDSATVYFEGEGGLPALPDANPLVKELTTGNPKNTAYYMDMPVEAQWPIYYDLDTTADNSFDALPEQVKGATWIATRRLTRKGQETDVSFTLARPATVFVMCTQTAAAPSFLPGFAPVDVPGLLWRNNDLYLVSAQLFSRSARAGETVHIAAPDRDAIVMLKE